MQKFPAEHMKAEEFVSVAFAILEKFEVERYQDDLIDIRKNFNRLNLQVERKAQDVDRNDPAVSHLSVSNPTTMVMDHEIIRHHGEHCYLVPHMKKLLASKG